jgi:hypothetical protein
LVNYVVEWVKDVFDWWFVFGMRFRIDWVEELSDLVEFWRRYEGLKV